MVCVRLALWRERFPVFHARWNAGVERELRAAMAASPRSFDAQGEPDASTRRMVWECSHAVSRAARLMPRASCLTQALVLQRVLARRGQECALFLGVDRDSSAAHFPRSGGFEAHAWIEWRERILIGGDISRWTPFPLSTPRTPDAAREVR